MTLKKFFSWVAIAWGALAILGIFYGLWHTLDGILQLVAAMFLFILTKPKN